MRMVESETRNKRTSSVPPTKRTLRWIGHSRSFGAFRPFKVIQGRWIWCQPKAHYATSY